MADLQLKPYAILDWLKQEYNRPEVEPRVPDSIRRTLERRVQHWKLEHGVAQEVKFPLPLRLSYTAISSLIGMKSWTHPTIDRFE